MTASFVFQDLANAMLDRVLEDEVDRAHYVRLPDAINAADALFDPHGIPRHVEVDDDVAELKVQAFAASIGRDQNANVSPANSRLLRAARASRSMLPFKLATEKPRLSRNSASMACVGRTR
jgi:hypothetical protein